MSHPITRVRFISRPASEEGQTNATLIVEAVNALPALIAVARAAADLVNCELCSEPTGTLCAAHRPALRAAIEALEPK